MVNRLRSPYLEWNWRPGWSKAKTSYKVPALTQVGRLAKSRINRRRVIPSTLSIQMNVLRFILDDRSINFRYKLEGIKYEGNSPNKFTSFFIHKTSSDHLRGLLTSILVIRQSPSDYFVSDIVRRIYLGMKNGHLFSSLMYYFMMLKYDQIIKMFRPDDMAF